MHSNLYKIIFKNPAHLKKNLKTKNFIIYSK